MQTNKYCYYCGSQNIEIDEGVDEDDDVVCGDCGNRYGIRKSCTTIAKEEFDQLLYDDPKFAEQWGSDDPEILEANFNEWYEDVYNQ